MPNPSEIPDLDADSVRRIIQAMVEGEWIDIGKCLSALNVFYEDKAYSSSQRIALTVSLLNEEQKAFYERHANEIGDDWTLFCDQFGSRKPQHINTQLTVASASPGGTVKPETVKPETVILEDLIDENFVKYSGTGDAKVWLLRTIDQFKKCGLRRQDQFEAIPLLLEDTAYLWYVENGDEIHNLEIFSKLFLQQFKSVISVQPNSIVGTVAAAIPVPDHPSTSHLQRTVADDIIKRPTYFRGSQDDVYNWLDKLEQRFAMAQWNDNNKLQYISIHLQDDAYRWWMQTSSTIKTWSSFTEAAVRAFGSTRKQELAFEQLKWYKQTINQSVTQYYDQVMELCKKVDPIMPDSMKLKYLMGGIKESLKTHVALQDPKTTEAFLSSARKIEDIMACTNPKNEPIPEVITLNATAYQGQSNQVNFARNNFRDFDSRQTRVNNYQDARFQDEQQQRPEPSKFTKRNQRSNACYNCGTPGHYARDCTRPHFQ